MEFTTRIDIPKYSVKTDHGSNTLLLGSCFADNIGNLLQRDRFPVMVNPFGTLYNPSSILLHLSALIKEEGYGDLDRYLLHDNDSGVWQSWLHHSTFSAESKEALVARINKALNDVLTWMDSTRWLVITLGSAFVYNLEEGGFVVANCHKQSDSMFVRERMQVEDIVGSWMPVMEALLERYPSLHVLFTVSPIRHQRDGLHANQLSKSTLLLATERLASMPRCHYFPAYEIMMDELRDYRFYADDMMHPSTVAVGYIYERFLDAFTNADEQQLIHLLREISARLAHKPFRPHSETYRQFLRQTLVMMEEISRKYPSIDFSQESELCNTQLLK